jgi:hypothetical protein
MKFITPRGDVPFCIPDDWWAFAEIADFCPLDECYIPVHADDAELIPLADIEPFQRLVGVGGFRKYKIVPVLFGMQSPEPVLPPIQLQHSGKGAAYPYQLHNGFHRYYASIAVGYSRIPALIE